VAASRRIIGTAQLPEWLYLFGHFFGAFRNALYPIEDQLIHRTLERLDEPLRVRLYQQFGLYNSFQRDGEIRQLLMYHRERGRVAFPDELRFAIIKDDVRLASVRFRTSSGSEGNVVLHVVEGRFFSLDFGATYHAIRMESELEIISLRKNTSDFRQYLS
jgi:hypothetical protein